MRSGPGAHLPEVGGRTPYTHGVPRTATETLLGRVLDGRYRVLSHLADGGMASVYRAVGLRLEREVALKVMRPDLARDEEFVGRFRREARSAARLSHPHVVAVYDQGSDGPHVFLAMELVEGPNLREVIVQEAPLTARAALDIIDPVLQALGAAHRAGLIHRDVKPENVILGRDGTVKVADFGLARAVTTATMTSNAEILLGTAAYLSPEQVERGTGDARSDVYAAGLLLYEMLTGVKAFGGDSPIQVAYQHVHGEMPVASAQVPAVPARLDALIALANAREPDRRPPDASVLLAELRRARETLGDAELDSAPTSPRASRARSGSPTVALGRDHTRPVPREAAGAGHYARTQGNRTRHRRTSRVGWLLAVLLLLGGGGAAATWYYTAGPPVHSLVPTLVGLDRAEAESALASEDLDADIVEVHAEQVPADEVIQAEPPTGTQLRHGESVELTVSLGPERYLVPDLVGVDQSEAEDLLAGQNLVRGEVSQAWDEEVPADEILSTSPAADAEVEPDTAVDLVVSAGPEPITVPDVTGATEAGATRTLQDAELTVTVTPDRVFSDAVPEGSVVSQSPSDGTLHRGDRVTLTLSKGPELIEVPDVFAMEYEEAESLLEQDGFVVEREDVLGGVFGRVRSQDPEAGTRVPEDTTVTLTVM